MAATAAAGLSLAACLLLPGCGLPAAPLPPSLNLPARVTDLSAARSGTQVSLTWTMPKRNTDKMLLTGNVQVRVCRRETAAAPCITASSLQLAPGVKNGAVTTSLPNDLTTGPPRVLTWFVELKNDKGRSAGLSNPASVLAGEAPPPVTGLSAEMAKDGVILRWTPAVPAGEQSATAIRLLRKLLTPPAAKHKTAESKRSPLAPQPELLAQTLLVPAGVTPGRALDKDIRFGQIYVYRAQRVAQITVAGRTLELAGALSPPVSIHAVNIFPPAVPSGLVAVANPAANGEPPSIDLSWQPDSEADLAGYFVYRRLDAGEWQRVSPAEPVVGPAFHDANVEPGRTYHYAVSAVGRDGLESARSAEAQETVPSQ
jgi:hypothetical protein